MQKEAIWFGRNIQNNTSKELLRNGINILGFSTNLEHDRWVLPQSKIRKRSMSISQNQVCGITFLGATIPWLGLMLMLLFSHNKAFSTGQPIAQKGVLELSNWDFEKDGNVSLEGEWSFYWQHFLHAENINDRGPSTFVKSPGMWRHAIVGDENLPRVGYGTLRLVVHLGKRPHSLMLYVSDIHCEYEMEVNGKIVASRGIIGHKKEVSEPQFGPQIPIIYSDTGTLDILVRLSDFSRGSGGILAPIRLGTMENILAERRRSTIIEWFMIGLLVFSTLYHFGLFLMRRIDISLLYFGFFSLAFVFRLLTRGQKFLFEIAPIEWWMFFNRLEFISLYVLPLLYLVYFNSLFKKNIHSGVLRSAIVFTGALVMFALFMPPNWHTYILPYFQAYGIVVSLYMVYVSYLMVRKGNKLAEIFLFGHALLMAGIINDILHFNFIVRGMEVLGYSSILFLTLQIYALAKRSTSALNQAEDMSADLEEQIYKRTEQLSKANIVKGKLLSIISHDLRSPLTSLGGFLNVLDNGVNKEDEKKMLDKLRGSLEESTSLLDNLLNWASSQIDSEKLSIDLKNHSLAELTAESMEDMQVEANEKGILIKNFVGPESLVQTDRNMFRTIMRNLLTNAIKFTPEGGTIRITSRKEKRMIIVSVVDSGIGLPPEMKASLFELSPSKSRIGTGNEKGSGIGLILCKDFVNQLGGEIWVEDRGEEVNGTVFSFSLPPGIQSFEESKI